MDIDAALDDIERVVVDGDMRPEARERASRALEVVAAKVERLTTAIHAATALYRDSLAIQPETLAGRMYDALAAADGDA